MEILKYCKLQIALFIIMIFVSYLFIKDGNRLNQKAKTKYCNRYFDLLFVLGQASLVLDGATAYTVNHLADTPVLLNNILHLAYLLCYQGFIFTHFLYWLSVTDSIPQKWFTRVIFYAPITITALVTIIFIPQIEYHIGEYTNYAVGVPAVASFVGVGLYIMLTLIVFSAKKDFMQKNKRTAYVMAFSAVCVITLLQIVFNETLVASIAVVLVVLSLYLCMENPTIKFLEFYHEEMVMGFATLVENKDGSTGEHIRRTSAYALIIAEALRKNPKYKKRITKDYILNLKKAAPMHDIGKIGVLDSILQKPGKLTDEEFAVMKKHPEIGARIIEETFGHLDDDNYESMASKVAIGHHEKWNGKGYPNHLAGTDIPLCARIMAVADVFDAVSAKRCYRDAMPLEKCFEIIRDGRGTDFDPDIVDAFFASQYKIEAVYHSAV